MKLISERELRNLLFESEQLRRLENAGVDNWMWYGEAMDERLEKDGIDLETWEDEVLPKLLDKYETNDCK